MCHKLDPIFFKRLGELNPEDACRRSRTEYDSKRRVYRITAIGHDYEIDPENQEIKPLTPGKEQTSVELGLLILFYLIEAKDIPLAREIVGDETDECGVHCRFSDSVER